MVRCEASHMKWFIITPSAYVYYYNVACLSSARGVRSQSSRVIVGVIILYSLGVVSVQYHDRTNVCRFVIVGGQLTMCEK